jgi:hypothetical protein
MGEDLPVLLQGLDWQLACCAGTAGCKPAQPSSPAGWRLQQEAGSVHVAAVCMAGPLMSMVFDLSKSNRVCACEQRSATARLARLLLPIGRIVPWLC